LAGETGTSGAAGSEFPVFKAGEGAFDRAKYEEQDKARVVSDGVNVRLTGKEIDEDLKVKKKSADEVIKNARKFYNESFEKNLKELGEGIDTKAIYFTEAYSGADSDRSTIGRKIDKGETIDGKEIFEMSKQAAENKIGNAKLLKDGRVTDIVENLGLRDVMEFDSYEDVQSDFDSKIKDEKLKFDPLLDKFSEVLDYFGVKSQPAASQYAPILYTPENMAIISALAKVLEAEGFTNESITKMSKAYDDNIKKLIEKKEGKKAEDVIKEAAQEAKKEEPKTKTDETKIEEKKSPSATGPASTNTPTGTAGTTGDVKPVEGSSTTSNVEKSSTGPTGPASSTSVENLTNKSTTGGTGATGATKVEDTKKGNEKTKKGEKSNTEKAQDAILESLGIKIGGDKKEGEGGGEDDKSKSKKGKGNAEVEAAQDKILQDLGLSKKAEDKKDGDSKGTTEKAKKETKETKIEDKKPETNQQKSETSSSSTSIKETQVQNLNSVSEPAKTETNTTQTNTTTTGSTANTNTSTSTATSTSSSDMNTASTSADKQKEDSKKAEETKSKEESDKMSKDMSDDIKSMVRLLSQLNTTLQNPLIVIPNKKNFN
jgi:hypothetical protein